MKCYCGGAGPAPEEVLGFDNALTRNALQAAAKGACRCSGVGSQVWSVQFLAPPTPRGTVLLRCCSEGAREGEGEEGGRERETRGCRFVCSCKLSLYRSE